MYSTVYNEMVVKWYNKWIMVPQGKEERSRNKGRKVPDLDWLVDVIPVPSDMVPRVV